MKDSGMSNSQFMKAQKAFQDQHPEYTRLVNSIKPEKNSPGFFERLLTALKSYVKYITRSGTGR